MIRIKYSTKFLKYIFVAAVLFTALTCSASALDVVDDLSGIIVVVDGGHPITVSSGSVKGTILSDVDKLDISSLDIYVPFTAPSDNVIVKLSTFCYSNNLVLTGNIEAGAYSNSVFYPHSVLPYSAWDYGYSSVGSQFITNVGWQVDTSSVPSSDFAWFVHLKLSGSAKLVTRDYRRGSVNHSGHTVTISNGGSTLSATQLDSSFSLSGEISSSGSYKSYYDATKYVSVAMSGLTWKLRSSSKISVDNGSISGTLTTRNSSFIDPSEIMVSSVSADVNSIMLVASRNDDDAEAVAELQKANATLTKISGDMDKFVSHQQEVDDTANNIGGTTSDGSISNTSTDFNSGIGTVDDFSNEATSHSDSLISLGAGFSSLMTMATPVLLNFGPEGHIGPLHIALLIVVAVLGVTFFVRRLL